MTETHELSSTVTAEVRLGRLTLWREGERDVCISLTRRAEEALLALLLARREEARSATTDDAVGPERERLLAELRTLLDDARDVRNLADKLEADGLGADAAAARAIVRSLNARLADVNTRLARLDREGAAR